MTNHKSEPPPPLPLPSVLLLGAPGVGKSSLCAQFLSSEHINAYDKVGMATYD